MLWKARALTNKMIASSLFSHISPLSWSWPKFHVFIFWHVLWSLILRLLDISSIDIYEGKVKSPWSSLQPKWCHGESNITFKYHNRTNGMFYTIIFYLAYFLSLSICFLLSLDPFQLNVIIFRKVVLNIVHHFNIRWIDFLILSTGVNSLYRDSFILSAADVIQYAWFCHSHDLNVF